MLAIHESRALAALIAAGAALDAARRQLGMLKPAARYDGASFYNPADVGRAAEFAAFIAERDRLEALAKVASVALQQFPKGRMGLTPDSVKARPEWQAARAQAESAHVALQRLNARNVKRFARELRAEREARRSATLPAVTEGAPIPFA